jgi:LPXTG-motif cell wall-anchored protein
MAVASRRIRALAALVAAIAMLAVAAPAMGATSTITQADCNAGRIKDKQGNAISKDRCERLIGQRVNLASTGFDAWWLIIGGVACIGGAAALRVRRRPSHQLAA